MVQRLFESYRFPGIFLDDTCTDERCPYLTMEPVAPGSVFLETPALTGPQIVLPSVIPIGGAGAWGLVGPTHAQALQTNDGDTTLIQSPTSAIPSIPQRVAWEHFRPVSNFNGWTLNVIARRAAAGVNPDIFFVLQGQMDAALAGGVARTAATNIVPQGASPDSYALYTYTLTPGEAALINADNALFPASYIGVIFTNGGVGTPPAVVNITQSYLRIP